MSDDLSPLAGFNGTARLFPLPNLVLFPHVVQPLHIFEPRYRQMTRDALAADRMIAMVLLRPGWDQQYEGRPAVHPVACLGRILAEQVLADGRYNLLLRGLTRVRITGEIDDDKLYRSALANLLADANAPAPPLAGTLRRQLAERLPVWFAGQAAVIEQFQKLFHSDLDLGTLADILSFALPLDMELKQVLLATLDVEERVRRLLKGLEGPPPAAESAPEQRGFPPEFSPN
jgi:Lon protease-like protein